MSKRNFSSKDHPQHMHFRVRDLITGEFSAKGGITATYSFSKDGQWLRLGASWCSLKDNYIRNRPFLLDVPQVKADLEWYYATKTHIDSLKQAGQTDEEIDKLIETLTRDAPSKEAIALLGQGFSKMDGIYGYWEAVGVSRSKLEWERNPAFINLQAAGWRCTPDYSDEEDVVLASLTLMSSPEAYTWWKLALQAGCFDTFDLQVMRSHTTKANVAHTTIPTYDGVTNPHDQGLVIT